MSTIPRSEIPRPDFVREDWQCLNGQWAFGFDKNDSLEKASGPSMDVALAESITVPFCYQSKASGIGKEEDCDHVWYKKEFDAAVATDGRVLLHFGAVDYLAKVWLNGTYLGSHEGGHTPFCFDVTDVVQKTGNKLVVKATDFLEADKPRGKQSWIGERFGCWYTPTTGIWQSVWLEAAGATYLKRVKMVPDVQNLNALCELFLSSHEDTWVKVRAWREKGGKTEEFGEIRVLCKQGFGRGSIAFRDYDLRQEQILWSPENPNLIQLDITVEGSRADSVKSYFGMREISCLGDTVLLNGNPYFQRLILDQGYWPESLLTPPSDEAIKKDLEATKAMGFNGARKHQKPEDPRFYYWADVMGLLVWGEMPSAYEFNDNAIGRTSREMAEFIARDYNHPCIVAWVPVNESWGVRLVEQNLQQQNYCRALTYLAKSLDATRLISGNDGWEQVDGSDICAIHDYALMPASRHKYEERLDDMLETYAEHRMMYASRSAYEGQPILLTEFGGIAFADGDEESWGYYGKVKNEDEFLDRLGPIVKAICKDTAFMGYCYTQLTDVMQETNGLLDENRNFKVTPEKLAAIFGQSRHPEPEA